VHLAASVPTATVIGIDVDRAAARCARNNGVRVAIGDVDGPLRSQAFDVVTAVAPYVPTTDMRLLPADVQRYEPARALDGGDDGLDVVRAVVATAARVLRPGGRLLTEIGGDQEEAITPVLHDHGFEDVTCWFDDEGDLRGIAARLGLTSVRP
jgi:release factor glutamine methyltransferase